jgi:hypothetical protein
MHNDKKEEKKQKIIYYLAQGLTFKSACTSAGVTEQTGHRYKREDVSFASRCEAGISKYQEKLIKCINTAVFKDARLALKMLAIRFPEKWSPAKKI